MRTAIVPCVLGLALACVGCPKAEVVAPGDTSGSGGAGGTAGTMSTAGNGGFGGSFGGSGGFGGSFGGSGGTFAGTGGSFGGSGGTSGLNCGDTYQRPVDVLFVIDNSFSMHEEQQALREQIPRMIATLNSGVSSDGTSFTPVSDLHVGVVSTDMGLINVPGRANLGCGDESRPLGDDGVLRNAPNPGGALGLTCANGYPPFLSFVRSADPIQNDVTTTQLANDFSCMASLGTLGCGFEMQLEAALRGLWPSDNMVNGQWAEFLPDNRPFLDGTPFGKGAPTGPNSGFLRNDPSAPSLLAIVMVTDEEDCSSFNLGHFVPGQFLANGDPLKTVGLNIRCHNESTRVGSEDARDNGQANLYATSRYAQAFKALRPGNEQLVVFAAIVGVPTELVTPARINAVDFSNVNSRNGFYDAILADSSMLEALDQSTVASNPNLVPSCLRTVPDGMGGMITQKAYPPRRIVKVAKELGENAIVQSICQDDFTPAIDSLLKRIGNVIRGECPLE